MSLPKDLAPLHTLAQDVLARWDVPIDAKAELLNIAENLTYLVTAPNNYKAVLRLHRTDYHNKEAIECELAWLDALRRDQVIEVPGYFPGLDGVAVQWAQNSQVPEGRYFVLFAFVDGQAPDESSDLQSGFETLGGIAARCHDHVCQWQRPDGFERLVWDSEAVFGTNPTWGNWRDGPGVTPSVRNVLEQVEIAVKQRLGAFGKSPDRYNLIHADMRLANLLVGSSGTRLIDFDDCGLGWFMYDFAAAISFIEDDPRIPSLKAAWLQGYRKIRNLDTEQEAEIETMVMLRRMALLAWIGSHAEAPEPQALAPGFADTTAHLGRAFLLNCTKD